jgi:phage I-like protein
MPWHIEQRDGRFCVVKNDDGTSAGCHDTEAEARDQLAALYAQEGTMGSEAANVYGTLVALAADQIADDGTQWVEVMPTAEEARNGPHFFTVTRDDLEAYARSIRENKDRIPIDRDHETEKGGTTRAAGWFTGEAEVRDTDDGPRLMAKVQWTKSGRDDLENREFRFLSPVFSFHDRDSKTGLLTRAKEILRTTLTNNPFFTNLAPVASEQPDPFLLEEDQREAQIALLGDQAFNALFAAANSTDPAVRDPARATLTDTKKETKMDLAQIASTLGLAADTPEADVLAAVKAAKEAADAADTDTQKRPAVTGNLKAVAQALGLDPNTDAATVIANLNKTVEAAAKAEKAEEENATLAAQAAKTLELEEQIKVIQAERNADRIKVLLADGVRAGKVMPAEKTVLAKQFASNIEGLVELLDSRGDGVFLTATRGSGAAALEEPEEVRKVMAAHESAEADGVDPDSARLHALAEQNLRAKGKTSYTEAEYLAELHAVATA